MTALTLFQAQLEDAGFQLSKVLEGMPETAMDLKATEGGMSPREQIAHLMEAYEAFLCQSAGRDYEWGTFKPSRSDSNGLIDEFQVQRGKAIAAALAKEDDASLLQANMYILGHDYYHVGQLCLARLAAQPDWNPYSIYREG